jgi:hypothetical protein
MFNHWFTFVTKEHIKYILLFSRGDPNLRFLVNMLIDDVVSKSNFFEGLSSGDDDLTGREDTRSNLLHILGRLKLDLHGTVPVRLEGNLKDVRVILEVLSHLHEIDVVVEAEVGVDHDNPERVNGDLILHFQKGLEDVDQLRDDPLTVKEITTASHLDRAVGEHFDRLGAV